MSTTTFLPRWRTATLCTSRSDPTLQKVHSRSESNYNTRGLYAKSSVFKNNLLANHVVNQKGPIFWGPAEFLLLSLTSLAWICSFCSASHEMRISEIIPIQLLLHNSFLGWGTVFVLSRNETVTILKHWMIYRPRGLQSIVLLVDLGKKKKNSV